MAQLHSMAHGALDELIEALEELVADLDAALEELE